MSSPDHTAITQGSTSITYRTLLQRSETVAQRLLSAGYGQGDVIGVPGPRGIRFVVVFLGVLRCGAVAFPIDPALPERRREHLLKIAKPQTLVHLEFADTGVPPDAGKTLPEVCSPAPAYLFGTSGTTGIPRMVLGWHGALSHFLSWQRETFAITPEDRCAQLTGLSFDVVLRDTLLALSCGGTLVIPAPADELGGAAVIRWLDRQKITVLHTTPTVLGSWLLDAPPGCRPPALRWTFLAGEPLKAGLVRAVRAVFPSSGIVNLYGPTETTLAKFAYQVPEGPLPANLPVGTPLPYCQGIIMRDGRPCGIGELGEIHIRTPFRSLGYLNDRAATAAAFVPNPYRDNADDRLYRTGDLGRIGPDRLLEVIGRLDHQVKINGVRIQPAEIERVLCQHPQVADCIVDPYQDHLQEPGETRLAAYVVPANARTSAEQDPGSGSGPSADLAQQLRGFLLDRLPPAMVPSVFIRLKRIPTTPNGKPDRAALPKPPAVRRAPVPAAHLPRTAAERTIQKLWAQVLRSDPPGIYDDFFELGGTSLTLTRLFALLDNRFPHKFRVAQLFTYPTIATQAALAEPRCSHIENEVTEHEF
ncbi:MAG: non-ribosomal peptide synthetase [Micromonosporaceae bacterium]|nr:non-ribosomal peptide synthetase [Micromonosporaceae bacterium]